MALYILFFHNLIFFIPSDVLSCVNKIKRQSQKSRQSLSRKFEDSKSTKTHQVPMDIALANFKQKTAFSNFIKCIICNSNIFQGKNAEEVTDTELEVKASVTRLCSSRTRARDELCNTSIYRGARLIL